VIPLTQKYLSLVKGFFPQNSKMSPVLIAIESAAPIADANRAYESFDVPKGTLRGAPPVPDDDLTTLRVPYYVVANKNVSDDVVTALTKAMMEARRDLVGEYPLLAQVMAPSTDKDAYVPIHPGAAAFFDGDEKTIFDRYGDQFFYGSMLLGTFMSVLAAIWKFMTRDIGKPDERSSMRLYALVGKINEVSSETDLAAIEQQINEILKVELEKCSSGKLDAGEMDAINMASQRLQYLMAQRRLTLNGTGAALLRA